MHVNFSNHNTRTSQSNTGHSMHWSAWHGKNGGICELVGISRLCYGLPIHWRHRAL